MYLLKCHKFNSMVIVNHILARIIIPSKIELVLLCPNSKVSKHNCVFVVCATILLYSLLSAPSVSVLDVRLGFWSYRHTHL